jgi:hypothetical protein
MEIQKLETWEDVGALLEDDVVIFGKTGGNTEYQGKWMVYESGCEGVCYGEFFRKNKVGTIEFCDLFGDEVEIESGEIIPLAMKNLRKIIKSNNKESKYNELNNRWEKVFG